jgi:hypothetical protein
MTTKPTSGDKRIFAAAESLSDHIYHQSRTLIQPEDLVQWIQCHIELRPEEQEEESDCIERMVKKVQQRSGVCNELRDLIGRPNLSLFECIHEAVHEIKRLRNKINQR